MVGVPGRSRACEPCKARRVACDQQHPQCKRCIKAHRTCEYLQNHIFVLAEEGTHKTKYRKECRVASNVRSKLETSDGQQLVPTLPLDLFHCFQARYALLSNAITGEVPFKGSFFSGILPGSSPLSNGLDDTLYDPLLACHTAWLGRRDRNGILVDVSRQLYTRALRETKQALASPDRALTDGTFSACIALTLYEALECPGDNMIGFLWHRDAWCRLLQLRGPEAHQRGIAHQLFSRFRSQAVLRSFDSQIPEFLASPAWSTIPWQTEPKTMEDELVDIFALGPKLVWLSKDVHTLSPEHLAPRLCEIATTLTEIHLRLDEFYVRLQEMYPKPLYWEEASAVIAEDDNDTISDIRSLPTFGFHDVDLAGVMTLYWATHAMVSSALIDLYRGMQELGIPEDRSPIVDDYTRSIYHSLQSDWLGMVRNVCRSARYCTSPAALERGPPRIGTQLGIVIDIMKERKGTAEELAWAQALRQELGDKWLRILRFLPRELDTRERDALRIG